jgi:hypothetical protein
MLPQRTPFQHIAEKARREERRAEQSRAEERAHVCSIGQL